MVTLLVICSISLNASVYVRHHVRKCKIDYTIMKWKALMNFLSTVPTTVVTSLFQMNLLHIKCKSGSMYSGTDDGLSPAFHWANIKETIKWSIIKMKCRKRLYRFRGVLPSVQTLQRNCINFMRKLICCRTRCTVFLMCWSLNFTAKANITKSTFCLLLAALCLPCSD